MPPKLRDIPYASAAWFRARRTGLVHGLPSVVDAAARVLGAQSQIEAPSRWALALRTDGEASSSAVQRALVDDRTLVRAWGQRDTVHLYAARDWNLLAHAQRAWPVSSRRPPLATDEEVDAFVAATARHGAPFTRSDLLDAAPPRLVEAFRAAPVNADPPERMAITRLIWQAGHQGELSAVGMRGREQAYAARRWWLPDLPWPTLAPDEASIEVCRRYLAIWAPARPHDVAHYLGARVGDVRAWLHALRDHTTEVTLDGAPGHLALTADLPALSEPPPTDPHAWPARLLPAYDTQMMSHANKDPLLADAADRPRVWAKAAVVAPTILHRGRFVATWAHKAKRGGVDIQPSPLTGGDGPDVARAIAAAVARDGAALAAHLAG
jgi:hypothetical protein